MSCPMPLPGPEPQLRAPQCPAARSAPLSRPACDSTDTAEDCPDIYPSDLATTTNDLRNLSTRDTPGSVPQQPAMANLPRRPRLMLFPSSGSAATDAPSIGNANRRTGDPDNGDRISPQTMAQSETCPLPLIDGAFRPVKSMVKPVCSNDPTLPVPPLAKPAEVAMDTTVEPTLPVHAAMARTDTVHTVDLTGEPLQPQLDYDYKRLNVDYFRLGLKPIYEGANGVIYRGTNAAKLELVTLKKVKLRPDESPEEYRRLVHREFDIMRACKHRNIIRTLDLVELEDEELVLVLPYYPKGDLLGYMCDLRRFHIELLTNVLDLVFKQVLKGVSYLHAQKLAHRDLKPENFLIDETGVVKILDFGYAVDLAGRFLYLHDHPNDVVVGTPLFKAPELFALEPQVSEPGFDLQRFLEDIKANPRHMQAVDNWLLGIIYLQMMVMSIPWLAARPDNYDYSKYVASYPKTPGELKLIVSKLNDKLAHFLGNPALALFKDIHYDARPEILGLLNPDAGKRLTVDDVLGLKWIKGVFAKPTEFIEKGAKALKYR